MSVATRSVLTVVFLGVGGYCLLRCVLAETGPGGHRRVHLLSDVAQLGMGVGMLAMLWRPVGDRWGVQLAFFAVGCGWFAARALKAVGGAARPELLHQAVAMAAMFWMLSRTVLDRQPGMAMAGMGMAGPAGVPRSGAVAIVTTLVLAGYLSGAALWWLRRLAGLSVLAVGQAPPSGGRTGAGISGLVFGAAGNAVCQSVMAAATATVLIVTV